MGSNEYIWESNVSRGRSDILTPTATSYHKCYIFREQFIASFGVSDDLVNPSDVILWRFDKKQWQIILTDIDSRSRTVSDMIGEDIVYIGGAKWNNRASQNVNIMKLAERSTAKIDEFTFKPFAAAGVYHKNSFYLFGGGGADEVDGSLVQNHASDIFAKYTLGDSFPCSKGS